MDVKAQTRRLAIEASGRKAEDLIERKVGPKETYRALVQVMADMTGKAAVR